MSHYIHHVPGRLRVRSGTFRCPSQVVREAEQRLLATRGVSEVRLNPRAGSVVVHYDPEQVRQSELLGMLQELGCLSGAARTDDGLRKASELFGKALVGAAMQRAVETSARTLVGALI